MNTQITLDTSDLKKLILEHVLNRPFKGGESIDFFSKNSEGETTDLQYLIIEENKI